jgi:hypothetical protein
VKGWSGAPCPIYPGANAGIEHVQRQAATADSMVVEGSDVEAVAERRVGPRKRGEDF